VQVLSQVRKSRVKKEEEGLSLFHMRSAGTIHAGGRATKSELWSTKVKKGSVLLEQGGEWRKLSSALATFGKGKRKGGTGSND